MARAGTLELEAALWASIFHRERQSGIGLQPFEERRCHNAPWRYDPAGRVEFKQRQGTFRDHFAGGAIARVTIPFYRGTDAGVVGIFADEQDVI